MELPPLEHTLSASALDYLFHRDNPPGAYTVFPCYDLWVVAQSFRNGGRATESI